MQGQKIVSKEKNNAYDLINYKIKSNKMKQQYCSIEDIELVLRVKKQSDTGLFKNERLLAIKSGYISYYSRVPKEFVGNTRSLQLIGQFPKCTFSAQHVTKITYKFPILDIEFQKDKLINRTSFKKIIENQGQNQLEKGSNKNSNNKGQWKFKSKQIDLTNAFVAQVQTCMKQQTQLQAKISNNRNQQQTYRTSLQPSLKMVYEGFKVAQEERQSKQVSQIINERASHYFTSEQIEHDLKKRTTELNLNFKKSNLSIEKEGTKKRIIKNTQIEREIKPIQMPQPFVNNIDQVKDVKDRSDIEKFKQNSNQNNDMKNTSDFQLEKLKLSVVEEKKDNVVYVNELNEITDQNDQHRTNQKGLNEHQYQQSNKDEDVIEIIHGQLEHQIKTDNEEDESKDEFVRNQEKRELQKGQVSNDSLKDETQNQIITFQQLRPIDDSKQPCWNQHYVNRIISSKEKQKSIKNVVKQQIKQQHLKQKKKKKTNAQQNQPQPQQFLTFTQSVKLNHKEEKNNSRKQWLKLQLSQQFVFNIESQGLRQQYIDKNLDNKMKKSTKFESVKEFNVNFNDLYQQGNIKKSYQNKLQKFIMYTDFINYPSLLRKQYKDMELYDENLFQSNSLIFNKYQSRLYDKFKFYTKISQTKSNQQDENVRSESIYYLRYKNYQGLLGFIEEMKQLDALFNESNQIKKCSINKKDQQQRYIQYDIFSTQLCKVLVPDNIFEAYLSFQMIKKLCIEQICLYLKMNSLVESQFQANQGTCHIEQISSTISRRNQYLHLLHQYSSQNEKEFRQFICRIIRILLQELIGMDSVNQNEKDKVWRFSIKMQYMKSNQNKTRCILVTKYHVKELTSGQMIILEQDQINQMRNANRVSLSHKQKQTSHNVSKKSQNIYYQDEQYQLENHYMSQSYMEVYEKLVELYMNSLIMKIVQYNDQNLQKHSDKMEEIKFTTCNQQNIKFLDSFCLYIEKIACHFRRLDERKSQIKQQKSQQFLSIKGLITYLSHQAIILSVHLLKLQALISFYRQIKIKNQIKKSCEFTQQVLARIDSEMEELIRLKSICRQELRVVDQSWLQYAIHSRNLQLQISNLRQIIDYLCSVVVNFWQTLTHLLKQTEDYNLLQNVAKKYKSINQGLQLIDSLEKILSSTTATYTHPYKYRLEINNLTQNPHYIKLDTVLQLLIYTLNKNDNSYFFKSLQLFIHLWKIQAINDSLIIKTFVALSQTHIFHNYIYKETVKSFLDNQIKTQDKIKFIIKHPILQKYYQQQ